MGAFSPRNASLAACDSRFVQDVGWMTAPAQLVLTFLIFVRRLQIHAALLLFHLEMRRRTRAPA